MPDATPPAPDQPQPTSPALAADHALFELWDRGTPFPPADEMRDLDLVTHVSLERAQPDGYHYLHGTTLACHRGRLHACWSNGRLGEVNMEDEILRGRESPDDGLTWGPARVWAQAPTQGAVSVNHAVLAAHQGRLWGFFTCWNERKPRAEIFQFDDDTDAWKPVGACIPGFVPFSPPLRMGDGRWAIGGEHFWYEAAVAVSEGDDWTRWHSVALPVPDGMKIEFPETTLIDQGDRILAVCRPRGTPTALVSASADCGRTWSPLQPSNFPMASAKPCAGLLSDGRHYLITNNLEEGRALLTIALTEPGSRTFSWIRKIRHQQFPRRRLFAGVIWHGKLMKPMVGTATEWSYPSAIECNGKLVVSYTHGKEDAVLSLIPLHALGGD